MFRLIVIALLLAGASAPCHAGFGLPSFKKDVKESKPADTFHQLSEDEQKELVSMAKAARAAYNGKFMPIGFRPVFQDEWKKCAAGCDEITYTTDGYFNVGSGLRGRLMIDMMNGDRVILALSGCDFAIGKKEFLKDFGQCVKHYFTCSAAQYKQALKVMNGVLALQPRSELWIVGHSLGGSLTTYLALNLPKGRTKVKCATFNGYGISPLFLNFFVDSKLAAERLRNVYCVNDVVFKVPGAKHYGPAYSLDTSVDWLDAHDLELMIKLMVANRIGWW